MAQSMVLWAIASLLVIGNQPIVECDEIAVRLANVQHRLAEMRDQFTKHMRMVFYDQKRLAEQRHLPALIAVSAKMAESEAISHAYQRRALLVASHIINKYLIEKELPLDASLVKNGQLAEIIIHCAYGRSIEHILDAIGQHRRAIYLLVRLYQGEPGVIDLARLYSRSIENTINKDHESRRAFEKALEDYREIIPIRMLQTDMAHGLRIIGDLIRDSERHLDQISRPNNDFLLNKYVNSRILTDIRSALQNMNSLVEQFDPNVVSSVSMADIRTFDNEVVRSKFSGVPTHLGYQYLARDMNIELDEKFKKISEELFYNRQAIAGQTSNFPLMALSVQMFETEGMMYVQERRMLWIIDDVFERNAQIFDDHMIQNRKPFDILVQRLINFANDESLKAIETHRKRIHWISVKYDRRDNVKDLIRDYASGIYSRKAKLLVDQSSARQLISSYRSEVESEVAERMLGFVEEIFELATEQYRRSSTNMVKSLRDYIDPQALDDIRQAKSTSMYRYQRPNTDEINAVTKEQIWSYEYSLFAAGQGPDRSLA